MILLAAAILFAGLVGVSLYREDESARQEHQQLRLQQNEMQARLARVEDDGIEIRARIDRYNEIIQRGLTREEQRLDWVETLRASKEKRRLLGLEYEIAPQRPLDAKVPVSGGYRFLASPMKFDLPMLHENDLFGVLDDLAAHSSAIVSVKRCAIERLPANHPLNATLTSQCELDWITLRAKP